MRLRYLLLTSLLIFLFAGFISPLALAKHRGESPLREHAPIPPEAVISKHLSAPPAFAAINIYGNLNIEVIAGAPSHDIRLISNSLALDTVQAWVQDGVLYVTRKTKSSQTGKKKKIALKSPVLIKISLPTLSNFQEFGAGTTKASNLCGPLCVTIKGNVSALFTGHCIDLRDLDIGGTTSMTMCGIDSRCLSIKHFGMGKINLEGVAGVQTVTKNGDGDLILPYVISPHIKIYAGGMGVIWVAGRTCVLVATMCDDSYLKAQCLHAERGFINTNQYSSAEVWASDSLSMWARQCSNIYYYNDAVFVSRNMDPPGNVMRMARVCEDLCCPCCYKAYK